jgi:hypothetical protein
MGALGRSGLEDISELQDSHTDEPLLTPQGKGEEDVKAPVPNVKVLSRPSSQNASYRVAAVPPLLNLETSSSKSNVLQNHTKASPKVTAVTLSRVETVQKAGASQTAV